MVDSHQQIRTQMQWADAHLLEVAAAGLDDVADSASESPWQLGSVPGTLACKPDQHSQEQHIAFGMHEPNARAAIAGDPRGLRMLGEVFRANAAMRRAGHEPGDRPDVRLAHNLAQRMGFELPRPGDGPQPPEPQPQHEPSTRPQAPQWSTSQRPSGVMGNAVPGAVPLADTTMEVHVND